MSPSMGFRMICKPVQTIRLECRAERKVHPPYDWALPGTLENLRTVDEFLKERKLQGYLFGGCLDKDLPRKDIDVFLDYPLEDSSNKGYKILGVDWWFNQDFRGNPTGRNVNGIETELGEYKVHYHQKEKGGLLLPKEYILQHPRNKLTRLLYKN